MNKGDGMKGLDNLGVRVWALATATTMTVVSPAIAQTANRIDIRAQPLSSALEAFGRQAGVEIIFDRSELAGKSSQGLRGSYKPDEALRQLVQGAGIRFDQPRPGTFVITDSGRAALQANNNLASIVSAKRVSTIVEETTGQRLNSPAQDGGGGGETSQQSIPEIIVTAERRAENVQDVPISVIAISGKDLRDRGIGDLNDLQSAVPSLSFVDNGDSKFLNIRGVGITESAPNQTAGVAIHLDGTYIAREFQLNDAFFDVESVQVLRGPQGTYSGQNASGGAIFIETARPSLTGSEGYAEFSLANYDHRSLEAAAGRPITDKIGIRFAMMAEERDSYYTNVGATGDMLQPGNLSRYTGRVQLLAEPTEQLELRLIHQYSRYQTDGLARQVGTADNLANPFVIAYDDTTAQDVEYNRTTGIIGWDATDDFRINLNATFQSLNSLNVADQDRTDDPAIRAWGYTDIADEYFTGEVNIVSTSSGPFEWTGGANMLDYKQDARVTSFEGATQIQNLIGQYIYVEIFRKNQAVFGEVGYQFTDALQVKVGGRYNHEENGWNDNSYITFDGAGGAPVANLGTPVKSFNNFTGRALVNWRPNPDHLIYTTISRGYKPGGIQPGQDPYDSEIVTNWELGWKADLLDRVVQTSVAAFFMDYDGFQATIQPDPLDPTSSTTHNVDNTRIKGIEAQISVNPGRFHADVAMSYLDAKYGDQPVTLPAGADGNPDPVGVNLKGRQINFAPEFSINGGVAYDIPVRDARLTPSVRVSHTSSQWATFYQLPYHLLETRTLVDARLTYKPNDDWKLSAYVKNLLDETYINDRSDDTDGYGYFGLGAPRELGVTIGYTF